MTADELKAAQKENTDRLRLNGECQRFAAGVCTKSTRGGSRLRAWRVAKTDRNRLSKLKDEAGLLLKESGVILAEQARRSHAEKTRA